MNADNSNVAQINQDSEYLDMIDVFGFVWRAKVWVVLGVSAGLLFAMAVVTLKKPPVYVTTLPVTFEVSGGYTSDGVLNKFNQLIDSVDLRAKVAESLGQDGLVAGKAPFKLANAGGNWSLEVSSKGSDSTGAAALEMANVIQAVGKSLNENNANVASEEHVSEHVKSELEMRFVSVASRQAKEEAPLRAKLFALESKLAQKAGVRPQPSSFVEGTSIGDDVLRMLGASEGKLTEAERQAVLAEYASLTGEIRAVQAKYAQPIKELTASLATMSGPTIADVFHDAGKLPVIKVDETVYRGMVATGSHERFESKKALFLILGVMLGGMLGLMGYGVKLFINENRDRIRAVLAGSKR